MTVRIGCPSYIFSNNAIIPSDIWSVGKEPIAMFEFTRGLQVAPQIFSSTYDAIPLLGKS
jgi:hypothetical protein